MPTFMVGWKDSVVGTLVSELKYQSNRVAGKKLAELLDEILPMIDGPVTIVPLPTIQKHIRARGLDHTLYLAKELARKRSWQIQQIIKRNKDTVQVGANRQQRILQAQQAYKIWGEVDGKQTYILLDDVWTTGASMRAALKKLQQAGAKKVIVTVLATSRTGDN